MIFSLSEFGGKTVTVKKVEDWYVAAAKGGFVEKNCSPNFLQQFVFSFVFFYGALVWSCSEILPSSSENTPNYHSLQKKFASVSAFFFCGLLPPQSMFFATVNHPKKSQSKFRNSHKNNETWWGIYTRFPLSRLGIIYILFLIFIIFCCCLEPTSR